MTYIPLGWTLVYYAIVNVVGLSMMLWDLHLAKHYRDRWVNELLMLFVAFLGAAPSMTVAMYLTHHKMHRPMFRIGLPVLALMHLVLIAAVALFGPEIYFQVTVEAKYVGFYVIAMSVVAVILTFLDKNYAKRQLHRIPEDTLMLIAGLGGSVGMLASMLCFRHKTRHVKFMLGLPVMILIQAGVFLWFWRFSNLVMFHH